MISCCTVDLEIDSMVTTKRHLSQIVWKVGWLLFLQFMYLRFNTIVSVVTRQRGIENWSLHTPRISARLTVSHLISRISPTKFRKVWYSSKKAAICLKSVRSPELIHCWTGDNKSGWLEASRCQNELNAILHQFMLTQMPQPVAYLYVEGWSFPSHPQISGNCVMLKMLTWGNWSSPARRQKITAHKGNPSSLYSTYVDGSLESISIDDLISVFCSQARRIRSYHRETQPSGNFRNLFSPECSLSEWTYYRNSTVC